MIREELQKCTVKMLREQARELEIRGRSEMTKDKLIEAILGAKVAEDGINKTSAKDECKIDNHDVEVETKVENKSANIEPKVDMNQKMLYIEQAEIGALVAFRLSNGKVKSAKIVKKSAKNRKLKLETEYGASYIIPYEDVVWIRTGQRWPKGVYNLLKGTSDADGTKEQRA